MFEQQLRIGVHQEDAHTTCREVADNDGPVHVARAFPVAPNLGPDEMPTNSAASRGLAQLFGLEVRAALLAVMVDVMVFAGDTLSIEALLPLGIAVAGALGFIVYKIQRKWHGDDRDAALIKAMIIGLLTAIPAPITPLVALPGGILGLLKAARRK